MILVIGCVDRLPDGTTEEYVYDKWMSKSIKTGITKQDYYL
jgi:hypothetical protein